MIPYIASNFRKDKIWLRRSKPSKREYQVMVAIDNSKSMLRERAGQTACEAVATITKARAAPARELDHLVWFDLICCWCGTHALVNAYSYLCACRRS